MAQKFLKRTPRKADTRIASVLKAMEKLERNG